MRHQEGQVEEKGTAKVEEKDQQKEEDKKDRQVEKEYGGGQGQFRVIAFQIHAVVLGHPCPAPGFGSQITTTGQHDPVQIGEPAGGVRLTWGQ